MVSPASFAVMIRSERGLILARIGQGRARSRPFHRHVRLGQAQAGRLLRRRRKALFGVAVYYRRGRAPLPARSEQAVGEDRVPSLSCFAARLLAGELERRAVVPTHAE